MTVSFVTTPTLDVDYYPGTGYIFTCSVVFDTYPSNAEDWVLSLYLPWAADGEQGVFADLIDPTYHRYPSLKKITGVIIVPLVGGFASNAGDPVCVYMIWEDGIGNGARVSSISADVTYHP